LKLKMVVIDIELTRRQKRAAALALLTAVVLASGAALAAPKTFVAGEVLKSADLNANFESLDARANAIEDTIADGVPLAAEAQGAAAGTFNVPGTLGLGISIAQGAACVYEPISGYTDCTCPAGSIAFGGGVLTVGGLLAESRNPADDAGTLGTAWRTACTNSSGVRVQCTWNRAYCARIAPIP